MSGHRNNEDFCVFALMHLLSWGPLCEPNFVCISVLGIASGPRVKLASCKSALLFVLRFYGPVNPMGSSLARSVYLATRLLGRLNPLSG